MKIITFIKFLLECQIQLKICHWQTKEYGRHMAFGNTYEELDELIDDFVESYMGKYGRFEFNDDEKTINIENISKLNLSTFLKTFKKNLVDLNSTLSEKDVDLLAIRDEILILINKLTYLLTLE